VGKIPRKRTPAICWNLQEKDKQKREKNIFELYEIVVYRRGGKLAIRKAQAKKKRKR